MTSSIRMMRYRVPGGGFVETSAGLMMTSAGFGGPSPFDVPLVRDPPVIRDSTDS